MGFTIKWHLSLPEAMWTKTAAMYENDTHLNRWFTMGFLSLPGFYCVYSFFVVAISFLTRASYRVNFNPQKKCSHQLPISDTLTQAGMNQQLFLFHLHVLPRSWAWWTEAQRGLATQAIAQRVSSVGGIMAWNSPGSHWFAASARLYSLLLGQGVWNSAGSGSSS